jgi:hypothetical protein
MTDAFRFDVSCTLTGGPEDGNHFALSTRYHGGVPDVFPDDWGQPGTYRIHHLTRVDRPDPDAADYEAEYVWAPDVINVPVMADELVTA